jgi:hypothetical protein
MSTSSIPSESSEYLLLFRNTNWHNDLSPEEIQHTMSRWTGWFDRLVATGKCKGGHPLLATGAVISGKAGTVSDGPFAESKEAVGGYFFLQVDSMEEAMDIARECPALEHGISVEVRPVAPTCPANLAAQQSREAAAV